MLSFVATSFVLSGTALAETDVFRAFSPDELTILRRRMMWTEDYTEVNQNAYQENLGDAVTINVNIKKLKNKPKNKLKKKMGKGAVDNSNMPVDINQESKFIDNIMPKQNDQKEGCRGRGCGGGNSGRRGGKKDKSTEAEEEDSWFGFLNEDEEAASAPGDEEDEYYYYYDPTEEPTDEYYEDTNDADAGDNEDSYGIGANQEDGSVVVQVAGAPTTLGEPLSASAVEADTASSEEQPKTTEADQMEAPSKAADTEAAVQSSVPKEEEATNMLPIIVLVAAVIAIVLAGATWYMMRSKKQKPAPRRMKADKYRNLPDGQEITTKQHSNSWIDDEEDVDDYHGHNTRGDRSFRNERVAVKKYRS